MRAALPTDYRQTQRLALLLSRLRFVRHREFVPRRLRAQALLRQSQPSMQPRPKGAPIPVASLLHPLCYQPANPSP